MKKLLFVLAALAFVACESNDSELTAWETELVNNAADGEDMERFIESACVGAVDGGIYTFRREDGFSFSAENGDKLLGGTCPSFLIDKEGTMRVYVWVAPDISHALCYSWTVSQSDPMVMIFTGEDGTEQRARLISYSSEKDCYYFEGNFPCYNDIHNGKSRYEYCVVNLAVYPERRAEVEQYYNDAKAENK